MISKQMKFQHLIRLLAPKAGPRHYDSPIRIPKGAFGQLGLRFLLANGLIQQQMHSALDQVYAQIQVHRDQSKLRTFRVDIPWDNPGPPGEVLIDRAIAETNCFSLISEIQQSILERCPAAFQCQFMAETFVHEPATNYLMLACGREDSGPLISGIYGFFNCLRIDPVSTTVIYGIYETPSDRIKRQIECRAFSIGSLQVGLAHFGLVGRRHQILSPGYLIKAT